MNLILATEFPGSAGDERDLAVTALFKDQDADLLNCGTLLSEQPVRDVEYLLQSSEGIRELIDGLLSLGVSHISVWTEEENLLA